MSETRYQPVTPAGIDSMPADVALEILTNPRNKLSARMRKKCMTAREKVFVSKHPILVTKPSGERVYDTNISEKPAKQKFEERFLVMRFARLNRVVKRMNTRIVRVRRALVNAECKIVVPWILNTLRNDLESKISAMETIRQIAINIINQRKTYGNKIRS